MINTLTSNDNISLVYSIILLAFISSSIIARLANRPVKFLKDASIWLSIIFVLVIAYSYRYEFKSFKNRLLGELNPSTAIIDDNGEMTFRVAADGHYHIEAEVNGVEAEFLLDTGASDVVITKDIARAIGIDTRDLNFNKIYSTANGTVRAAPIIIDTIEIGKIRVNNVRASVSNGGLETPLLGMSFLDKLHGYDVKAGVLTLKP